MDLIERLRAAIDATERIAQAASGDSVFDGTGIVTGPRGSAVLLSTAARHIARHDPASVLRRCAADRKILDWLAEGHCNHGFSGHLLSPADPDDVRDALAEAYEIEEN